MKQKSENQKAFPRFLGILVVASLIGGVLGGLSGVAGYFWEDHTAFGAAFAHLLGAASPWAMAACAAVLLGLGLYQYRKSDTAFHGWDGEDEDVSDAVDRKLSAVIWLTSAAFILSYFLIAASYSGGFATFDSKDSTIIFFIGVAAFFGIMAEATVIQQKCVDTTKQMNPEKKASVYDMRFQKKWLEDCDEAEKLMIGKCAFKAYAATNAVCTILAIVLAVCALVFDIGFLPSLMVCLVWIVNLSVYCKEAMRYSKVGSKIS